MVEFLTKEETRVAPTVVANTIPSSITNSFENNDTASVNVSELIQFCDKAVNRINSIESHLNSSFQNKINSSRSFFKAKRE